MHSPKSPSHNPDLRDRAARVVFGLLSPLIVAAFVVLGLSSYTDSVADESEVVGRQVRATGRVEATGATPVPCLIEGGATVLNVVPHGKRVRKGDVLARLDTTELDQSVHEIRIKLAAARAAQEVARQNGIIQENTLARETEAAELAVTLARLDRTRYLDGDLAHDTARLNLSLIHI